MNGEEEDRGMKSVIYNGPSPLVKIGGYPDHVKGRAVSYPDDVADILVNQSKRQRFAFVEPVPEVSEPEPAKRKPGKAGK